MRRDEHPIKRINPGGAVVWVARWTDKTGKRRTGFRGAVRGSYAKQGPCRAPLDTGECCAQHAIWKCYELDAATPSAQTAGRPLTVETYALHEWLRLHPRSERTDVGYMGRLRAALPVDCGDGPLGAMLFADVEFRHAVRLIDVLLRDHGRAAHGARAILGALSAMWRDAMGDGWARTANPFLGHRIRQADQRVSKPARQPRVLSWSEMHLLARAAGAHEPSFRVMSDCGLRLGEMMALHREDVKLGDRCDEAGCVVEGPHLHVRRKAWMGREQAGTKSGAGRVVPVPPALERLLRRLPPRIDTPLMFPGPSGVFWEPDWRRDVWYVACEAAGLRGVNPHDLRHSYVSHVRAAGVDVADAAAAAGHTVETATRVYTHALHRSHEAMRKAVGE